MSDNLKPAALASSEAGQGGLNRARPRVGTAHDAAALVDTTNAEASGSLSSAVARAFAAAGPLARADPGYVERLVQQEFAQAVALALEQRSALVA